MNIEKLLDAVAWLIARRPHRPILTDSALGWQRKETMKMVKRENMTASQIEHEYGFLYDHRKSGDHRASA